jgi:PAS domain S-box-containing protein
MPTKNELEIEIKKLKKVVEELQSLKSNEKVMIEQSPDAILYTDNKLKIVYINKKASELLGYNINDICSKHIQIISKEYEIEKCIDNENCFNSENSVEFEAIRKDKSIFYCELKLSILKDNKNKSYGYMVVLRDISELKKTKEELERTAVEYKNTIDLMADNIIITQNNKVVYVNPATEKLLGYSYKDVIGTNFTNYIAKSERKRISDYHIKRLSGEDVPLLYDTTVIDKYGHKIHIEINNSLITQNGENAVISILRDVTQRKLEKDALERNYEDKLKYQKQAMDLALDGIAILDKDKKIIYANNSYLNMYNCSNDIEGNYWNCIYSDNDIDTITKNLNGGKNWKGDINKKTSNDKELVYEMSISVLDDKGIIIIVRDITSSILIQKELKLKKEEAIEADRLKSAFLANMSHELRTPINSIKGFADIINDDSRKISRKKLKTFTSTIKRRSEELIRLISDIIDISKIEANQISINDSEFSLNYLLEDLKDIFTEKLKYKDKQIKLVNYKPLSNTMDNVITDETRLKQIISNLLDNAVKFTDEGEIQFGYTVKDDNIIEFFVKDTGMGMTDEQQNQVFERFVQANAGGIKGGNGLGLTISKSLVTLLGGEIWVNSQIDKGTTFFFTIKSKNTIQNNYYKNIKKNNININNVNWQNRTILYVEDDEDNINLMKELLKPTKVKLIVSKDGLDAEEKYKKYRNMVDLILMDIRLPKRDGLETTKVIKKINKKVPIIAQTAYAMKGDDAKMKFYGCDDYISKPIEEQFLLNKIDYYLQITKKSNKKLNYFFNRIFSLFS